jgi:hypothetical protein
MNNYCKYQLEENLDKNIDIFRNLTKKGPE